MVLLHRRQPSPQLARYQLYKGYLRQDFSYRCVYCSIHENEWGGPRHFHVEHFRPKSLFPHLLVDYANLLYACDVCNVYKGDDWPSDDPLTDGTGYLDPCEHDYDLHFVLLSNYQLHGQTGAAIYMIEQLHLNRRQLKIMREMRAREEALYLRSLELCDDALSLLESSLSAGGLSPGVRQSLEVAKVVIQGMRDERVDRWEGRLEPLYGLEDF